MSNTYNNKSDSSAYNELRMFLRIHKRFLRDFQSLFLQNRSPQINANTFFFIFYYVSVSVALIISALHYE